jgi:hypothetical protein
MTEWPDYVPVFFVDGPLAGEVHQAPARAGLPAMMLRVRLGEAEIEVRSARDQGPATGWVSYLGLGSSGARARAAREPWPFVYAD